MTYERDIEPVIFPKGVRQLLGWAYAMEAIDPHEPSIHAKMVDKFDNGEIRPFPLSGMNLSGLTALQRFALAAGLRNRVEEVITEEQRMVVWAKYCDCGQGSPKRGQGAERKVEGMSWIASEMSCVLRRRIEVIADCVWHIVCTDKQREQCTLYAIGKRHGVGIMTICRDVKKIKGYMRSVEESAHLLIKNAYPSGDVV